ncbi:MAG: diadenylate cyclase CdaA [Fimbriimonadaceae bacterium]
METVQLRLLQFSDITPKTLLALLDILIVAFLCYKLLRLIRGSRAWRIVTGVVIYIGLLFGSQAMQLQTLHWILDKATVLAPVALVILLLPELRHALEGLGKIGYLPTRLGGVEERAEARTVEELVAACAEMSQTRVGALIVIERGTTLDDIIASGVAMNAKVSAPLLGSIFYDGAPLHDGAAIIRGDSIVAAACRLPLSDNPQIDGHLRHRAAVGASEAFDCLVIVVSEERGVISIASDGVLRRLADHAELRDVLNRTLRDGDERDSSRRRSRRSRRRQAAEEPVEDVAEEEAPAGTR